MLADEAVIVNGLVNVTGGGWRYVARPEFPTTLQGFVVGVVEVDDAALGSAPVVRLAISGGQVDGAPGSTLVIDAFVSDGHPMRAAFRLPFSFVMPAPGDLVFTLSADGFGELAAIPLPVISSS